MNKEEIAYIVNELHTDCNHIEHLLGEDNDISAKAEELIANAKRLKWLAYEDRRLAGKVG